MCVSVFDSDASYMQRLEIGRKIGIGRQSREVHHLVDVRQMFVQLTDRNYRSCGWIGNIWHGVDVTCDDHANMYAGLT